MQIQSRKKNQANHLFTHMFINEQSLRVKIWYTSIWPYTIQYSCMQYIVKSSAIVIIIITYLFYVGKNIFQKLNKPKNHKIFQFYYTPL